MQGGNASILDATIGGSLQVEQNAGLFSLSRNRITGDLQANANTGTGLTINRNIINGNLQCQANDPAPSGTGNRASSKEDQCASL
jgi:hypothetical protein